MTSKSDDPIFLSHLRIAPNFRPFRQMIVLGMEFHCLLIVAKPLSVSGVLTRSLSRPFHGIALVRDDGKTFLFDGGGIIRLLLKALDPPRVIEDAHQIACPSMLCDQAVLTSSPETRELARLAKWLTPQEQLPYARSQLSTPGNLGKIVLSAPGIRCAYCSMDSGLGVRG